MIIRLRIISLAAIVLLLSILGCSKKDDPTAPAIGKGSYKLDGVLRNCLVTAATESISSQNTDELTITLVVTPQPASGTEAVTLTFSKSRGQLINAYQLEQMLYLTNGGVSGTLYKNDATTLQETSSNYAGTFSGTSATPLTTSAGPTVYPKLTEGVFADVRP